VTRSLNSRKLFALVRLSRPANLPTAAADILAGTAVGAFTVFEGNPTPWFALLPGWFTLGLVAVSVLLYGAGVVLNDYYDRELDAVERPERPIPAGLVKPSEVLVLGWSLAGLAFIIAAGLDIRILGLALILMSLIWFYNYKAKKSDFWGPFFMGSCRALNFFLGLSPFWTPEKTWLALVPLIYIFAVTAVSRGEVHGGNRRSLVLAGVLYLASAGLLSALLGYFRVLNFVVVLGLLIFMARILYPLYRAWMKLEPARIRVAVKAGVLSLVLMDSVVGLAFGGWPWMLLILSMLAVSMLFSRFFQVT